jgi:CheY-like chemotaxis protein
MDAGLVLVVDDDAMLRDLLARVIAEAGYRVLTAGDGDEALALAGTLDGQLQLVVTDVRMPVMDGVTLARHLTEINPRLPVLFVSGFVPLAGEPLPGPLLAKPFTPNDLLRHVRRLLGSEQPA